MQRLRNRGFCGCFLNGAKQVARMSLNRCEQRIFDYLQSHPEERHFWQAKLQSIAKASTDDHVAVARLEPELWRYYEERSAVAPIFKEAARYEGLQRISMKNLAELLIRLWTEPRPKKKKLEEDSDRVE
jgi:hypothetical protein